MSPAITIRLDPARLADPDADLRYVVPDLIAARSGGAVRADGYDYDRDAALDLVREVLAGEELRGRRIAFASWSPDARPLPVLD